MSNLDQAKHLIAKGDKDKAIGLLASILLKNKNEVEAWLLLGEMIDDPSRKKDCYRQVVRLSPHHLHALTRLQELGALPPAQPPSPRVAEADEQVAVAKTDQKSSFVPTQYSYPPVHDTKNDLGIIVYVIGGIAAILAIIYFTGSMGNPSSDSEININSLFTGLVFIGLVAGLILLFVSNTNRD